MILLKVIVIVIVKAVIDGEDLLKLFHRLTLVLCNPLLTSHHDIILSLTNEAIPNYDVSLMYQLLVLLFLLCFNFY